MRILYLMFCFISCMKVVQEIGEQSVQDNHPPSQMEEYFDPLQCSSSLQIGYNQCVSDQATVKASAANGFVPGWML
ncbi:hypothetical protein ERO13_D12G163000v2 [Gossypium hirsutum]|uniref:Agamous-like MADS-box protein MADS2 n=2 Tax=Gossypium TaxID=3633 RepID=A0ABM3B794_GOSHI|nr:agamous-like MADS-box protein MADS2 [Gossypium hirsutum]KAG4116327.1 hypothetical protein ERO13_D12G163000v2 [Gossypium hirsutum]